MRHSRTLRSTNPSRLRCTHRGLRSLNVRASRGGLFAFVMLCKPRHDPRSQARTRRQHRFKPKLYGRAEWDPRKRRFTSIELIALGERQGRGTFNSRGRDTNAAPMGVALTLYR